MSDEVTPGEMPLHSTDYRAENVYRVNPANSDDARKDREQFEEQLKKQKEEGAGDQSAAPKTSESDVSRRGFEKIHDDVILSNSARQIITPPNRDSALPSESSEQPKRENESEQMPIKHIHLTA